MEPDPAVIRKLRELFGDGVSIQERRSVGGGCINATSVLLLDDGRTVFLKENPDAYPGLFRSELQGLGALSIESAPTVPKPYGLAEEGGRQYLFLEYIEPGRRRADFWEDFGRRLARLHRIGRSRRFGFATDNYIGANRQINRLEESWPRFFARHRLGVQLELARTNGHASERWFARAVGLLGRLEQLLPEPEAASLLHGDLWAGNYMVGPDGRAVLIDPAVYYGDREADLAMTELFGGFDPRFYAGYNEEFPLEPGYEERRELYNLYHLLNHLNLFGGSYAASVASIVARFQ